MIAPYIAPPVCPSPEDEPLGHYMLHAARSRLPYLDGSERRYSEARAAEIMRTMTGDVERTMVGSTGTAGGFTTKIDWGTRVIDKARTIDGPIARCTIRYTKERQFAIPGFLETSRATGSRWGGVQATWGLPEINLPATSQPKTSLVNFAMKRLLVYIQTISRDLLADTDLVVPMLSYAAQSEVRYQIENAMINGVVGGPTGVTRPGNLAGSDGSAATAGVVQITRKTTGQITDQDIYNMWAGLYAPCKRTAIWVANDDTVAFLDQISTTYAWPDTIYLPDGRNGNPFALIRGRPLIPCEACPPLGNPGDLVLADWSQYWLVIHKPKATPTSSLTFDVAIPRDDQHQGIVALPDGAVEQLMSDHILFSTDSVSLLFKLRADGQSIWPSTMTNVNNAAVGWASVISH